MLKHISILIIFCCSLLTAFSQRPDYYPEGYYSSMENALKEPKKVLRLDVFGSDINKFSEDLGQFENLEMLYIDGGDSIRELPKSLLKNKKLHAISISDSEIPAELRAKYKKKYKKKTFNFDLNIRPSDGLPITGIHFSSYAKENPKVELTVFSNEYFKPMEFMFDSLPYLDKQVDLTMIFKMNNDSILIPTENITDWMDEYFTIHKDLKDLLIRNQSAKSIQIKMFSEGDLQASYTFPCDGLEVVINEFDIYKRDTETRIKSGKYVFRDIQSALKYEEYVYNISLQYDQNNRNELENDIETLGHSFPYLIDLSISGAGFSGIPNEILKLTGLEALDLSGNPIKHLPEELLKLEKLSYFALDCAYIQDDFDYIDMLEAMSENCTVKCKDADEGDWMWDMFGGWD